MIQNKYIHSIDLHKAKHSYGKALKTICADQPFSFLVWNVNKNKIERIQSALQGLPISPDFFFLQEIATTDALPNPFQAMESYQWVMGKNLYLPQRQTSSGVKTGSLYTLEASKVWHTQSTEPLISIPKTVLSTVHDIQNHNDKLLNLNVHFLNFVPLQTYLKELESAASVFEKHTGPIIFSGDFNTWSSKRVASLKEFADRFGLVEVVLPKENRHKWTFKQLSFVFTRGIHVLDTKVITEQKMSDHYPLWIQAKINASP